MISSLQLAKLCGVSQGTVDRALHDRPGIGAATKARILAVAAEHGYTPNPVARELMSGRSALLGVIVPAVNSVFFMDLVNEVKRACDPVGLRPLITPVADAEEFLAVLGEFAARRFRGAIVVPPAERLRLPDGLTCTLPVATLLSACRDRRTRLVAPDEVATGRAAVDYLTGLGHERIVHVTYRRSARAIRDRRQGYREAMRERGLRAAICPGADPEQLGEWLRRRRPTALFCHNDWLALAAMRTLTAAGLRVPEDISVLGVDDSPTFTSLFPNITTLHYPAAEVAAAAVAWIAAGTEPPPIPVLDVVERETVRGV